MQRSRESVVGIATGYGLDKGGVGVPSPGRVKNFSLLQVVQTGSGVHPTSYPTGTGGSSLGVKRQRRESNHLPPASSEVKKMWIYTSNPSYSFMA
jgi:hypothetical protein